MTGVRVEHPRERPARQEPGTLKRIASENYTSPAVLLAMGNWFPDKYAEGTIGRRPYAGREMADRVEEPALRAAVSAT